MLSETDWDANLHSENIDQSYQEFMTTLTKALDTHAPITKTTIPFKQVIRQPWMTSGLIKCSRKCDRLYAKSIGKGQNTESCQNFTRYRNVYNSIKRKAKAKYFTDILQNYANDIRKTWRVLNSITGRKNYKSTISDSFFLLTRKLLLMVLVHTLQMSVDNLLMPFPKQISNRHTTQSAHITCTHCTYFTLIRTK